MLKLAGIALVLSLATACAPLRYDVAGGGARPFQAGYVPAYIRGDGPGPYSFDGCNWHGAGWGTAVECMPSDGDVYLDHGNLRVRWVLRAVDGPPPDYGDEGQGITPDAGTGHQ